MVGGGVIHVQSCWARHVLLNYLEKSNLIHYHNKIIILILPIFLGRKTPERRPKVFILQLRSDMLHWILLLQEIWGTFSFNIFSQITILYFEFQNNLLYSYWWSMWIKTQVIPKRCIKCQYEEPLKTFQLLPSLLFLIENQFLKSFLIWTFYNGCKCFGQDTTQYQPKRVW